MCSVIETPQHPNQVTLTGNLWRGRLLPLGREAAPKKRLLRSPAGSSALATKVTGHGDTVKGATEGWWVPEYVIKGDPERGIKPLAPELKSVADLARYKDVFRDPEDPSRGRFLNSPTGWTSEIVNSQKLKAYDLTASYVNFRTGSGAALDAEVASSRNRMKWPKRFCGISRRSGRVGCRGKWLPR